MFSGDVEAVSNTAIFVRVKQGVQWLVYQMSVEVSAPTAMVLPVPVDPLADEGTFSFIDMSEYPEFFDDLAKSMARVSRSNSTDLEALDAAELAVERVGSFDASFVPTWDAFARLDPRFQFSAEPLLELRTRYPDWAFAVFQLAAGRHDVHPMAFRFNTRWPRSAFYPCLHLHDGRMASEAHFDHALYGQGFIFETTALNPDSSEWSPDAFRASQGFFRATGSLKVDSSRAGEVFDREWTLAQRYVTGTQPNADVVVQAPG